MNKSLLLLLFILFSLGLYAQNCTRTSVGLPPLDELGTHYYRGYQGGLYPGGSNAMPYTHADAGLRMMKQLQTLDTFGNPSANGKIVWLSIGMSNTTQETQAFLSLTDTFSNLNPSMKLIDGAQSGMDIVSILNPQTTYWNVVNQRLHSAGLSTRQVQIIWLKEAMANPKDTVFPHHATDLQQKFTKAIQLIRQRFPNARIAYLSTRIYAGYATSTLNPEPFAWQTGWAIKGLIQQQIQGDTSLAFEGSNARSPWLAWGPYLWADGIRKDSVSGVNWICPDDFITDGTHPSTTGRMKVARALFQFFTTDPFSRTWFLKEVPNTSITQKEYDAAAFQIYPNPTAGTLSLSPAFSRQVEYRVYSMSGQLMAKGQITSSLDLQMINPGVYIIHFPQFGSTYRIFEKK